MVEDNKTAEAPIENNVEKESKVSLRASLEKNFEKSADELPKDDMEGTATEPAKGKSFVNNEVQAPVVEPPAPTVNAPADMSPAEKEAFAKLSPEMQNYQIRRAQDARRQISEAHEMKRTYHEFDRIISPDIRQEYAKHNIRPEQIVENALAWDKSFKVNKNATAIEYLKAQGVDINELYQGFNDGSLYKEPEPKYLTPEEAEAIWAQKNQEAQESRIATENHNALQSFLGNPIFQVDPEISEQRQLAVAEEVRILKEIRGFQGTPQQLLDKALEEAIKGHPIFSSVRQAQQPPVIPEAAKSDVYAQMERVRQAKKASRSISGSPGSGSPVTKASSIRESLEQNWAKS